MFNRKTRFINPTIANELNNEFNEHEMSVLTSLGTIVDLDAHEIFATEGAVGQEAVILVTGTAHVMRDGDTIAEVGSGTILGESSLLTNEPRNASLMTTSPTKLVVLNRREFSSFLDECPRVAAKVDELVSARTA